MAISEIEWLRVRDEAGLARIAKLISSHSVNTFTGPRYDKNGDPIIMLGWDDKPDSDWGRFRGYRAAVWFASEELAAKGEIAIRKALGFAVTA